MEEKRINEIQKKADKLLREKRLKQALELIGEDMDSLNSWDLRSRFSEIQTAYNYMLEYMEKGMFDPDRANIHNELIGKTYLLNDETAIARLAEHSLSVYSQMCRKHKDETSFENIHSKLRDYCTNMAIMKLMPSDSKEKNMAELSRKHEKETNDFFMLLWSQKSWNNRQQQEIQNIFDDKEIDSNDKAIIVSAITMSLLKIFDPQKVMLLCNASSSEESIVSQRALVGLAIILFINSYRIEFYPELRKRIELLNDVPEFEHRLLTIQIQLLRCRETQKIDRKMREEIIPAMLKNPHIRGIKLGFDIEKELEQEDKNPEWESWLQKDDIKNKLDEMAQWQIEGADVYMSTFSQLKNYPFFNEMPNWFRPFDANNPMLTDIFPSANDTKRSLILKTLFESKFFCNSDKYSFCFTFQQVPPEQRDMLMQQLGEQHGNEAILPESETSSIPRKIEEELQSNQYIQDLYRFFKLSSFKKELPDPFILSLNFIENKYPGCLLKKTDSLQRIFQYLVQKEYYDEAFKTGIEIEKQEKTIKNSEAQFYQEMGYCCQKQCDYDKAIEYYRKADIIKPDTLWTIRHMAQCHRMKKDIKGALDYYLQAEQYAPENKAILLQTGECFAALQKYDEAFSRFFKVEYLDSQSIRSWRAIAWCSFIVGKYEQARIYYAKLLATDKPDMQDWLNSGHVELVNGNNSKAMEYYRKSAKMCATYEIFINHFFGDKKELVSKGISTNDMILIRDIIYQSFFENTQKDTQR